MTTLLRFTRPWRSLAPLPARPSSLPSKFFSHRSLPRAKPQPTAAERITANQNVLYLFIGTNVSVYAYGTYAKYAAHQGDVLPFSRFLKNMTLNYEDVRAGYWWQALTSNYTHLELSHIFNNLFTTFFLGRLLVVQPVITPGRIVVVAVCGGLLGSACYLGYKHWLYVNSGERDTARSMGFSGAVMSMCTVAACLAPKAPVKLYGFIPMPLWVLVGAFAAYDGYYLNDTNSRTAHSGHLGGCAFGVLYYLLRLRGLRM